MIEEEKMAKFMIGVKEVHIQYIEIEADNGEEALDKVKQGEGTEKEIEYSCTLDSDEWYVNEIKEQE